MTDPALTVGTVLTPDLREWLLATLRHPVLALVTPRGTPNQSVMWFDLDPDSPDTILMNTKVGRTKERWLRERPEVSVCFEDGWRWVAFQGRAELDDNREASQEMIYAMARRYGADPNNYAGQERVAIRIRVEKVIRHDE